MLKGCVGDALDHATLDYVCLYSMHSMYLHGRREGGKGTHRVTVATEEDTDMSCTEIG